MTERLQNCKTFLLILEITLNLMAPEVIHKNMRVSGRVQGVGFRFNAREAAFHFGIRGFIRNQPNGDVYIEAEGSRIAVDEFIVWCKQGPPRARVDAVDVTDGEVRGFGEFLVR
jgi:acylphosphatase